MAQYFTYSPCLIKGKSTPWLPPEPRVHAPVGNSPEGHHLKGEEEGEGAAEGQDLPALGPEGSEGSPASVQTAACMTNIDL